MNANTTSTSIVVMGASAGGVQTLINLFAALPANFPAPILVVVHIPANAQSHLPAIISRAGPLPAHHAEHDEPLLPGQVYIAPPNRHLLVANGRAKLSTGPREHGLRPAIDPLFRSAAGPAVIGVVLSGTRADGSAGLLTIKAAGGIAIVQDPDEALFSEMPRNAINQDHIDYILTTEQIAARLPRLTILAAQQAVSNPVEEQPADGGPITSNPEAVAHSRQVMAEFAQQNTPGLSPLTCPDCGGALLKDIHGEQVFYHCHVGHAYSTESLIQSQGQALEKALWIAIRTLEERAALADRLATQCANKDQASLHDRYRARQTEAAAGAEMLRSLVEQLLKND